MILVVTLLLKSILGPSTIVSWIVTVEIRRRRVAQFAVVYEA